MLSFFVDLVWKYFSYANSVTQSLLWETDTLVSIHSILLSLQVVFRILRQKTVFIF